MGDDRKLINPNRREYHRANLQEALGGLKDSRQQIIEQMRQTGESPSWFSEAVTGVPDKLKVWYYSGPMAPTAPNAERGYFREQADKEYEQQKAEAIKQHQRMINEKQSPWQGLD